GSSVTLGPLMADLSNWFERRRGVAVALVASSNYFAGTFWPPVVQHFIAANGWRATHVGIGVFCAATMLPIVLLLPPPPDMRRHHAADRAAAAPAAGNAAPHGGASACRPGRADACAVAEGAAAPAVRRRGRVLRGDVDAAGAHRRVLRRSRLWRRARR